MSELVDTIRGRLQGGGPWLIGVGGAVAVGKTTVAAQVAEETGGALISTDAFLHPNAVLTQRNIAMRKGFPESYDAEAVGDALDGLANGERVSIPVYSHEAYDIVEGEFQVVEANTVVIEGVMALQDPVRAFLDVAVYVDAEEPVVRGWFVDRFLRWTEAAKDDTSSFYHGFASLDPDAVRNIAEMTWDGINAVNLKEHIAPTKDRADIVVTKGANHDVTSVITIER